MVVFLGLYEYSGRESTDGTDRAAQYAATGIKHGRGGQPVRHIDVGGAAAEFRARNGNRLPSGFSPGGFGF